MHSIPAINICKISTCHDYLQYLPLKSSTRMNVQQTRPLIFHPRKPTTTHIYKKSHENAGNVSDSICTSPNGLCSVRTLLDVVGKFLSIRGIFYLEGHSLCKKITSMLFIVSANVESRPMYVSKCYIKIYTYISPYVKPLLSLCDFSDSSQVNKA